MRPQFGVTLTPANVLEMVHELAETHIVQPKLNGDRVILRNVNGAIECWNRHQNRYSFNVNAVTDWASIPDGMVLDGEGYAGKFYPFEVVLDAPTETRIAEAKHICRLTGNAFIFDAPTDAWLLRCAENLPQWEGVVGKQKGTTYEWLGKPNYTSWQWVKLKW